VVVCSPDGSIAAEIGAVVGRDTNQAAEYQALIRALEELRARGARRVNIFTDSQFVTRQFTGEYKVRDERMRAYLNRVREVQAGFASVTVTHILRSSHPHNVRADKLANRALDDAARPGRPR
jgi:ribonuclease HI